MRIDTTYTDHPTGARVSYGAVDVHILLPTFRDGIGTYPATVKRRAHPMAPYSYRPFETVGDAVRHAKRVRYSLECRPQFGAPIDDAPQVDAPQVDAPQ